MIKVEWCCLKIIKFKNKDKGSSLPYCLFCLCTACPFTFALHGIQLIHWSCLLKIFIFRTLVEIEEGGSEERCEHGHVIYHVFKLWLMKIKYYDFYNILYYLIAIILINSDNINYCRVLKIGRFLQFSQLSMARSGWRNLPNFWQSTIIHIE